MVSGQGAIFSNFTLNPDTDYQEYVSTGSSIQSLAWLFQANQDVASTETVNLKIGLFNNNPGGSPVSVAIQFYEDGARPTTLLRSQLVSLTEQPTLNLSFSGIQLQTGEQYWFVISAHNGDGMAAIQLNDAGPSFTSTDNPYHYGQSEFDGPSNWSEPGGYLAPNMEITVVPEPAFSTVCFAMLSLALFFIRRLI